MKTPEGQTPEGQTPAHEARLLIQAGGKGALATLDYVHATPYSSLVLVASDAELRPLLLLSDLAVHTKNIRANPSASLLLDSDGGGETLASSRVSLQGRLDASDDKALLDRFIARHPEAGRYAGFGDFSLYRMTLVSLHLISGFGRIHWLEPDDIGEGRPPID